MCKLLGALLIQFTLLATVPESVSDKTQCGGVVVCGMGRIDMEANALRRSP